MSGIYLHIPFCDTKCIYCDFYSITNHSQKEKFLNALEKEIIAKAPLLKDRKFNTIFFGGGTPSLLGYNDFARLFDTLFAHYNISPDTEITIEANPGTLNSQKLTDFKKLPINRISFGVQSFNDDELKFLTRIHSAGEAISSIKTAQDVGFNNINLDLIFALPNQSMQSWSRNLETAASLNTQHISAYSLIFEEGTALHTMRQKGKVNGADIELEQEMYEHTMSFLESSGYRQYEISNYSKPGFECRHNLKYWTLEEYIAFGPSASSFVANQRWTNVKNLGKYIELVESGREANDFIETIDNSTAVTEHIFLGLRSRGINFSEFKQRHQIDFTTRYATPIDLLIKNGFATTDTENIRLTRKGYALCDEIVASLF